MISSAQKITKNVTAVQSKTAGAAFFRKAGEKSFFEASENHSFFGKHVQAKLTVSQPDDPKEKEADLVADKVMRMAEPTIVMAAAPLKDDKIEGKEDKELQREHGPHTINKIQCKEDKVYKKNTLTVYRKHESDIDVKMQTAVIAKAGQSIDRKNTSLHPSEVIQCSGRGPPETAISFQQNLAASKGGGNPLPDNTRNFMENRFSADFSNIRVHNNSGAQQMSTQIQAHAFTHANDIYFNNGKYSPDTSGGKTLLAHEFTHTIQQGASPQISKVAAKKENNIAASGAFTIYRKLNNLAAKYTPVTNIIHTSPASISSAGFSLTSEAKEYFEDSLKADVSDIRIHSNVESALLCRSRGVPAFVEGRNIIFDPSRYSPDSEDGGILLANKIAESLKQRSINVPGLAGQLSQGINQVKTGGSRSAVKKTESNKKDLHFSKDKKKPPLKGKGRKNASGNGSVKKGKGKRKKSDVFSGKTPKPNPKKSPASPEEDPAFYKVVKSAHARSEGQKKHDDPVTKARDAQQAAKAVANEAQSAAKKRKTDGMEEVANEDKPFDTESFKEDLLKKIEEVTPKQLEDVTEFKENNKIDNVKTAMGQKVVAEKDKTAGPVEQVNQQPLQVNEADNKKPVALPPTPKGYVPLSIGAKDAAPKPKMDAEISMDNQSQQLDTEMKANNVTEDQLAKSNEPSFTNALKEKNNAQKDAKEKPLLFRKNEAQGLKSAQAASNADASKSMLSMFSTRGKNFDGAVKQQQTSKEKDEQERAAVVVKIQSIYQLTEATVTLLLTSAETVANSIFDTGNEKARKDFENYVDSEMRAYKQRRYSGFWGGLRWGKDKLFGMPKGVNKFYTVGRQRYLDQMEIIITQVAQVITTNLNAAKQTIKNGKKQIAEYVSTLQGSLKNVGKEAAENIQDKFDSLEQSVNDKREQLVDGLAKKYVDNLKKLDDRITELKDANKGLIDKAIGLLKEVWKVIKNLVQLFKTILSRIASVIELIIDDPGKFFDNLGAAFSQGFDRFKNRIGEHLENGLMAWLSAQIGVANIILPDKFDVSAIFGLVLQVLGLSYENIKERAVILIGEERVALLEQTAETGADIFQRIRRGGLGAVWEMIKEKLTDFKDMIWEAIKTFIKESVVKAAITFILSLLNPVAAFVKACMAIYQFIMMLVRMKDRIIDLLNSIMDAVAMIAAGSVDKAAAAVEMAFAKSIPIIIGFFAALLGLNDIGAKVRNIMLRIKEKINKVIDWILTKAYSIVKPVIEAAMRIKNKGKQLYEKGKEVVIGAGKKVVGAIAGWLGFKKKFTTKSGVEHTASIRNNTKKHALIIESDPVDAFSYFNQKDAEVSASIASADEKAIILRRIAHGRNLLQELNNLMNNEKEKDNPRIPSMIFEVISIIKEIDPTGADAVAPNVAVFRPGFFMGVKAISFEARYVHKGGEFKDKNNKKITVGKNHSEGSKPKEAALSDAWRVLEGLVLNHKWTKFHILNADLGGAGVDSNMITVPKYINDEYFNYFEKNIKTYYKYGLPIWLRVVNIPYRSDYGSLFPLNYTAIGGAMKYKDNQWIEDEQKQHNYKSGIDKPATSTFSIKEVLSNKEMASFLVNFSSVTYPILKILQSRQPAGGYKTVRDLERAIEQEVYGSINREFTEFPKKLPQPTDKKIEIASDYKRKLNSTKYTFE